MSGAAGAKLRLHAPAARPPLRAGEPLLWGCTVPLGHPRAAARQLLRELLADYLEIAASALPLHFTAGQAPHIAATWRGHALAASLSYAGRHALIGLCAGARLGVDITPLAPFPDAQQVARLYLGPAAAAALAALLPAEQAAAFAHGWAALEARAKCDGRGLEEWSPQVQRQLDARSARCVTFEDCGHVVALSWAG